MLVTGSMHTDVLNRLCVVKVVFQKLHLAVAINSANWCTGSFGLIYCYSNYLDLAGGV